jgi:hypothetical protein
MKREKQDTIREKISDKIVQFSKPIYFYLKRNKRAWEITQKDLALMPIGTLGNDLSLFLNKNKFDIIPKAEFHDVFHVIFEIGTEMKDEVCIQFVPLGNGAISFANLITTAISILIYPEMLLDFYKHFQRGRKANKFYHWDWEQLLQCQTNDLRAAIFQQKI